MKFSTRTLYGLKAVLVLAMRYGEGSLSVSHIAKKEGFSVHYLEQILNALKKKGIVKSVRGPQGGYALAQKPSELTLEGLFYSLEGRGGSPKEQVSSEMNEMTIANALFWQKFERAIQSGFSDITLKDLVDEARSIKKTGFHAPVSTFHI